MRNKVNNSFPFKQFADVALRLSKCNNYIKKLQYIINIQIATMIMCGYLMTSRFICYWIKTVYMFRIFFFHILTSTKIRNCEFVFKPEQNLSDKN